MKVKNNINYPLEVKVSIVLGVMTLIFVAIFAVKTIANIV